MAEPGSSPSQKPSVPPLSIPPASSLQSPSTPSARTAGGSYSHSRHKSIDLDELRSRVASSPVARRMSMSSTPQDQSGVVSSYLGLVRGWLRREGVVVGGLCAGAMLTGTLFSLPLGTALSTSLSSTPLSTAYLAQKSNFINSYLVKLSWLHTSVIYLIHLGTSPPSSPKFHRFAIYLIATALWAAFTNWFFGAGLGDRIIELSGGACALVIPPTFGTGIADGIGANLDVLKAIIPGSELAETQEGTLLHLPSTFCTLRKPLTETTHPELFDLLGKSVSDAAASVSESVSASSSMPSQLSSLIPRWRKGFDISGHAFLLTLAAILLSRELGPTWRRWAGVAQDQPKRVQVDGGVKRANGGASSRDNVVGLVHTISGVVGTVLVGVWIGMLGVTGLYFHDPPEKLSGLLLGLAAGALLNLAPSSPFAQTSAITPIKSGAYSSGSNENRARRGDVVDDGAIVSPLDDDEDENDDVGRIDGSPRVRTARGLDGVVAGMQGQGKREKAE